MIDASSAARRAAAFLTALLLGLPSAGLAETDEPGTGQADETPEERIERLEETIGVLADEIDSLSKALVVPEEQELVSVYGFGPAASKVYLKERGLSIGGYGEVLFRADVDEDDNSSNLFDALRGIVYVGYKFNDWIIFNSEYEFEHAGSGGGGSVSIEFMNLDFLLHEALNVRAGLLLIPMGFVNEIHEPVFFYGSERPEVERTILPSTNRENGAGFFGNIGERISYRMYAVNGYQGSGFTSSGLRGGRQKGSRALSDHFAFVGRFDVNLYEGLDVGASVWAGKSGQNEIRNIPGGLANVHTPDTRTVVWEVHGQYQGYGAKIRALWTQAHLDQAGALSRTLLGAGPTTGAVASRMVGGYIEAGYDILQHFCDTEMTLEPFYRYSYLDTQDRVPNGFARVDRQSQNIHVAGFSFKPHPQVVVKLDYRNFSSDQGNKSIADEVQAAIGFVF